MSLLNYFRFIYCVRSRHCCFKQISSTFFARTYFPNVIGKTFVINSRKDILVYESRCNSSRNKYKSTAKDNVSDDESDESDDEEVDGKLVTLHVTSLRLDVVLKAALGIARNKVETMFYESRIRINGKKVLKKSVKVNIGDELDLVKENSSSSSNDSLLEVSRVELVSANPTDDETKFIIKVRRQKRLTIPAYSDD